MGSILLFWFYCFSNPEDLNASEHEKDLVAYYAEIAQKIWVIIRNYHFPIC